MILMQATKILSIRTANADNLLHINFQVISDRVTSNDVRVDVPVDIEKKYVGFEPIFVQRASTLVDTIWSQGIFDVFEQDQISVEQVQSEIRAYEKMYGFKSDTLLEMSANGQAPDEYEIHAWLALLDTDV